MAPEEHNPKFALVPTRAQKRAIFIKDKYFIDVICTTSEATIRRNNERGSSGKITTGSLFIYKRKEDPFFGFAILNTLDLNNTKYLMIFVNVENLTFDYVDNSILFSNPPNESVVISFRSQYEHIIVVDELKRTFSNLEPRHRRLHINEHCHSYRFQSTSAQRLTSRFHNELDSSKPTEAKDAVTENQEKLNKKTNITISTASKFQGEQILVTIALEHTNEKISQEEQESTKNINKISKSKCSNAEIARSAISMDVCKPSTSGSYRQIDKPNNIKFQNNQIGFYKHLRMDTGPKEHRPNAQMKIRSLQQEIALIVEDFFEKRNASDSDGNNNQSASNLRKMQFNKDKNTQATTLDKYCLSQCSKNSKIELKRKEMDEKWMKLLYADDLNTTQLNIPRDAILEAVRNFFNSLPKKITKKKTKLSKREEELINVGKSLVFNMKDQLRTKLKNIKQTRKGKKGKTLRRFNKNFKCLTKILNSKTQKKIIELSSSEEEESKSFNDVTEVTNNQNNKLSNIQEENKNNGNVNTNYTCTNDPCCSYQTKSNQSIENPNKYQTTEHQSTSQANNASQEYYQTEHKPTNKIKIKKIHIQLCPISEERDYQKHKKTPFCQIIEVVLHMVENKRIQETIPRINKLIDEQMKIIRHVLSKQDQNIQKSNEKDIQSHNQAIHAQKISRKCPRRGKSKLKSQTKRNTRAVRAAPSAELCKDFIDCVKPYFDKLQDDPEKQMILLDKVHSFFKKYKQKENTALKELEWQQILRDVFASEEDAKNKNETSHQ